MTCILRRTLAVLIASLAYGGAAGEVSAQSYPTKPLHMIVPFVAGGSPDIIGRLVAEDLGPALGQSVVVENRAGAGGNIAVQYVIDQPADGYTLLLGTSGNMAANKVLYRNLKFDTEVDLVPISVAYTTCNVLIVSATGPIKSVADLVAEAKKNPGALSFGSPGVGTAGHLIGELFKTTTGAQLVHVPYRGQSQVINDLLGGHFRCRSRLRQRLFRWSSPARCGRSPSPVRAGWHRFRTFRPLPKREFKVSCWRDWR